MAPDREQENPGFRQAEAPLLCANNCGFFGCPTTMNLCSKCYNALHVKLEGSQVSTNPLVDQSSVASSASGKVVVSKLFIVGNAASTSTVPVSDAMQSTIFVLSGLATDPSMSPPLAAPQQVAPSGSTRCISCQRRVGLLGFKCKCGGLFCSVHRYTDKHDCTFDYKAAGSDAIAKANPLVKAEKIKKI